MDVVLAYLVGLCIITFIFFGVTKLRNFIISKQSTYFDAAVDAFKNQKYVQAIELLNKSYKKSEIYRNTLLDMLATSYLYLGNFNKAIECLNQLLEIDQSNIDARLKLACIYRDNNLYSNYVKIIEEISGNYPLHIETLCHVALINTKEGNHQKTIETYEKILSLDQTNAYVLGQLAIEYVEINDVQSALIVIDKAILYGNTEALNIKNRIQSIYN